MSLKKFNPYAGMRIDKVKAHSMYLKKAKKDFTNYDRDEEEDHYDKQPWEIANVKHLCAGKPKPRLDKETIFDVTNDGKPIKKEKETKKDKDTRAYIMFDGKKYHAIGDKPFL
tara:strand:+ start:2286 stop:2624 length:339 start_codon:yes stop_codon:yes gene_type:complete